MSFVRICSFVLFATGAMLPALDAVALTVDGHVRFWDERIRRGNGSSDHRLGPVAVGNQLLPGAYIQVWDQDGCKDVDPTCGESDDDLLGGDAADSNGYFSTTVGATEDVYLVAKFWGYWTGSAREDRE